MTELFKRIDASLLHPLFFARLRSLLEEAREMHGIDFHVISGFRSYDAQQALYDQGRTKPGPIVTNAKPGESAHCFGIAADVCVDGDMRREGLQPDWRPESYVMLATLAPRHELAWGGTWRFADRPHLQLPDYETAQQLAPLRLAYTVGGLLACWRELDKET